LESGKGERRMNTEQRIINKMFSSARSIENILIEKNEEIERLSEMIHRKNTTITILKNKLILIDERCEAEIESKGDWDAGQAILEIQEMVHE
jgi:predicted phosphoribosyltransferase